MVLFWVREVIGWLLVAAGLFGVLQSMSLVGNREVVGGAIVAGMAIFVFRGGLHLIKVATAARIVLASLDRPEWSAAVGRPERGGVTGKSVGKKEQEGTRGR
ncbi:MAG: hypothetical protein ACRC1K_21450 [Planctomycetia bacterium]